MASVDITAPLEQEGTKSVVRKWLVAVGDQVQVNDPLVELETDKVSVEVAAEAAGVLSEIVLESGAESLQFRLGIRLGANGEHPLTPVPEPHQWALMLGGLLATLSSRRLRQALRRPAHASL